MTVPRDDDKIQWVGFTAAELCKACHAGEHHVQRMDGDIDVFPCETCDGTGLLLGAQVAAMRPVVEAQEDAAHSMRLWTVHLPRGYEKDRHWATVQRWLTAVDTYRESRDAPPD